MVPDIAIGIDAGEIPAAEPLAAIDQRLFIGALPVAQHQRGVGAMHGQQADAAGWQRFGGVAVRIEDGDTAAGLGAARAARSEERRVGKEGVSTCRYWWSP